MDHRSWALLANTLWLVVWTLVISLPLGTALAVALFRTDVILRRAALVILALLLVIPLYVQATAWQVGFGPSGWLTLSSASPYQTGLLEGWPGAIWVHAMAAIPWVTLIVGAAVRFTEPELEELALLDAGPWQVLRRVTLRQALPAIGLAGVWIAITVATEMTVTDLFQTGATPLRTFAEEIYTQSALGTEPGPPPTTLIGVFLLGGLAALAVMLAIAAGRWRPQLSPRPPLSFQLGRWRWPVSSGVVGIVALMFAVPAASLVHKAGIVTTTVGNSIVPHWSLGRAIELVADSLVRFHGEIIWSLSIAACAATGAMVLSLLLALLARRGAAWGLPALIVAVAALATPGPLVSLALISLFNGPAVPALNALYDRSLVVVSIAQAIRGLPLALIIVWHAIHSVPEELLATAALDGAGRWSQFRRVIWPLRRGAIALAWLAAFLVATSDFSSTMVAPPGVETISGRVSQMLHANTLNELSGLCLFLLLAASIIAFTSYAVVRLSGRKSNAMRLHH